MDRVCILEKSRKVLHGRLVYVGKILQIWAVNCTKMRLQMLPHWGSYGAPPDHLPVIRRRGRGRKWLGILRGEWKGEGREEAVGKGEPFRSS